MDLVSRSCLFLSVALFTAVSGASTAQAGPLMAGVARVDISNPDAGKPNDPIYARALVLKDDARTVVLVTLDAVAIAEIGSIKNEYLGNVRASLAKELKIEPSHLLVNASHCHAIVCADVEQRTVQAVKEAHKNLVPVTAGVGVGHEDRIQENRRLLMKSGKTIDIRRAYSLPPDDQVAAVGPIDPQIGILRLDRKDGKTLAVVYNFACHPIEGVPSGGNTADLTGFSSKSIEDAFDDGTMAFFVQGCGGDINPIRYKDVTTPQDAEPLGNLLALSTIKAAKRIQCGDVAPMKVVHEKLDLPRADLAERIEQSEAETLRLMRSLRATNLNLKSFMALVPRYAGSEFPADPSYRYLHEKMLGRNNLAKLDARNRADVEAYLSNVYTMEELTRVQTNLALLKKHQAQNIAAGKRTVEVEVNGLRIGDFVLVTFPGELTVQIGLNIKKTSPHKNTFVAGYTNGYIYYAPTSEQLKNVGGAQEDSDCILAPEWHPLFEAKVAEVLKGL
ncbi:MAG: hypothetical protein IT428_10140 [Planctomycetaceae bacterium]|nr:hypothetical protein [Planctomycetaceae bacterium]